MIRRLAGGLWLIIGAMLLVLPALPLPGWSEARDQGPLWTPNVVAWGIGLVVVAGAALLAGRLAIHITLPRVPWPEPTPLLTVAGLSVAVTLLAVWVMRWVFASNPQFVDEMAQLFHARVFASGRLAAPAPQPADAFLILNTWITKGGWVSLFPPGETVLLALGLLAGVEWLVNPLLGGLSVGLVYCTARGLYGRRTALAAAFLWATSAWVMFMSGTYTSHVGVVTFSLLAWAMVFGSRTPSRARHAVAGLALAAAAATRPLDAVGAALPVLTCVVVRCRWRTLPWMVLGGLPVMAAWGYVNWRTFGSPLAIGYKAVYGGGFGLGFGVDPWGYRFTPLIALANLVVAVRRLHLYAFEWPIPALLPLAIWAVAARHRSWRDLVSGVGILAAPVLYFFYWHSGFYLGPRFYYFAAPFLIIATARAWRWAWIAARRAPRRWLRFDLALATGALVVMVWGWAGVLPARVREYRRGGTSVLMRHPERELARLGVRQAVVLVPEGWGTRVIARLWGLGVPPAVTERAYYRMDTCGLYELALAAEAGRWPPEEIVRRLESRMLPGQGPPPPAAVPIWPDPTVRLRPGYTPPEVCQVELGRDYASFTLYGHLAWRNQVGLNTGIVFARDLFDRDDLVLARYPGWQVWRYAPPAGSPGAAPVLTRLRPEGESGAP